jgi:hypothetical protein
LDHPVEAAEPHSTPNSRRRPAHFFPSPTSRSYSAVRIGFVSYLGAVADAQVAIDDAALALKDAMAGQLRDAER